MGEKSKSVPAAWFVLLELAVRINSCVYNPIHLRIVSERTDEGRHICIDGAKTIS